uniref:NR LBD domain-containing protein n=1 Tax=Timema genevievae TaxID=629358 RepID=A0A7R9JT85_TIMGE|nr:unnamed protein product [Timema genevievae]
MSTSHLQSFPSPTSAASVPSPSSPPENATLAASKTSEMFTEVNHMRGKPAPVSVITPPVAQQQKVAKQFPRSNMSRQAGDSDDTPLLSSLMSTPRIPVDPYSIESILSEAIKLEFEAYSSLKSNQNSRELNDAERAKLNELIVANKALHEPLDEDLSNLVGDDYRFELPHSQANLNVNVDVLKEARGNIYEEHQRFLRTFDPLWRVDENIMLILSAISLFTPERPRVVHHDVIKLEQNSYYYLLRRYLESVYPGCEARSTFLKLIQKISDLHRLNDDLVRVYFDVNPRDVEPLLIEIFDLKPH